MTWLKTDDNYSSHRKIRRLSDGAYRLHHTGQCYAAHDETDGLIREEDFDEMQHGKRLKKYLAELIDADLWEVVDGGWRIHDFLDYNPSHTQLEAKRANDRDRQARSRENREARKLSQVESQRDSLVTRGGVTAPRPDPTRPDPVLSLAGSVRGLVAKSDSDRRSADARDRDGLKL